GLAWSWAGIAISAMSNLFWRRRPLAAEIFVEIVEDLAAARDPLRVILGGDADALDQRPDARDFGAAELAVLQVDVVNDLADGAQRRVLELAALEEHLERALVALMGELGLEHVEAQFAGVGAVAFARHELELRLRIDEAADQPGAGNAVDIDALPRHPG